MASFTQANSIPRDIPSSAFTSGLTYTGMAPHKTRAFIALLCTFLGKIILSPLLHAESIIACTADVVPPTIRNAFSA